MLDERIAQVKELIARREEIDAQLKALLNIESAPTESKSGRHCSKCGELGHRATTCPNLPALLSSSPVV